MQSKTVQKWYKKYKSPQDMLENNYVGMKQF